MSIKAKIAALLAKAQGTDNEHEAGAFMAKVLAMLDEHGLDMGEIVDADDPVATNKTAWQGTTSSPSWERKLYAAVARYYGCKTVSLVGYRRYDAKDLAITGRESARVTVEMMYPWIRGECLRLGTKLYGDGGAPTRAQGQRAVGNALVLRIWSLIRAQEARHAAEPTQVGRNALVTIDRVDQQMAIDFGDLTPGRKGKAIGTTRGAREHAATIGLHRQTTGSNALRLGGK